MKYGHVGRPTNREVATKKREKIFKVLMPVVLIAFITIALVESHSSKELIKNASANSVKGTGQLVITSFYKKTCKKVPKAGVYQSSEPCPNQAIKYWASKKILNEKGFVYPADKKTGLSLGAWPKNYKNYSTQLSGYKTYHKYYIWPITPTNGIYVTSYNHQSMDIGSKFGTPVYSPADGEIVYSEWGGTKNRGSDETAYSITIRPYHVVTYGGTKINEIFITHLSGIRYRCWTGSCGITVKKGQLIGFSGTAAGSATSVGWSPHLHITLYNKSNYDKTGLYTPTLEKFYSIKNNTKRKVGQ